MRRVAALAGALAIVTLPAAAAAQTPAAAATRDTPSAGRKAPAREDRSQPVTVDADKMERFGKEGLVVFTGNVVARHNGSVQYADRMEVYLDERSDKVLRTVSTGSVRIITRDCRTGTAQRAEYYDLEQRVVLLGNARVWKDDNVVSGQTITIFLTQDRAVAEGGRQERVKGVFYRNDDKPTEGQTTAAAARPTPATCEN